MALSTYLESEGLADETFERCGVTCGGPHLQLSIARRSKLKQTIVTSIVQLDCRHGLLVAAVEALRQTQDRSKRANGLPAGPPEAPEAVVPLLRRRLPMVPGHERDGFDLVRIEAAQVAVLD
jgi:hypothetical protein